jgi:hypothetical protein
VVGGESDKTITSPSWVFRRVGAAQNLSVAGARTLTKGGEGSGKLGVLRGLYHT